MRIELTIARVLVEAELYDHPVADEFASLLPLELILRDFNAVEKVASLG